MAPLWLSAMAAALDPSPRIQLAELQDLATAGAPLIALLGCRALRLGAGSCEMLLPHAPLLLRPGGTIAPGDLLAQGRIVRLGRRLAVGEVTIAPAAGGMPVAHATGTCALPEADP